MNKPTVLILGKLPPPFMGPAIATKIILHSQLNDFYNLVHSDTKINDEIQQMGVFSLGKLFRMLTIYKKFEHQLKEIKPELVLIPVSQTTIGFVKDSLYIWLAKKMGAKVLIQLRGSNWKRWLESSPEIVRSYVRRILKKTDGVIVLGECLKYLFKDYYKNTQIYVVPNGANYKLPPKNEDKTEKVKLLYLANFLESKGFKELLESLIILKQKGIANWELEAAGNWNNSKYEEICKKIIDDNRLNVTIHPPKWGSKKFQLFSNADIFIFPPNEPEGHPWVIVEAMAAGLPIISTNQGAICESVIHQENGFIVGIKSPEEIAKKLDVLINNEALRLRMGFKSKEYYFKNFTEERMVENLKNTFKVVLS